MIALVLVGLVAVRVPAGLLAARRRLSDHPGADLLPRRQPAGDGDHGDCAARGAAGRDSRACADDLLQLRRRLGHHLAVRSVAEPRRRRAERPAGHQRGQQLPAERPARAADLREGQSGRPADPDAGGHLQVDVADPAAGHRQQPPRHEDFRSAGRRPRDPIRRQRARRPGRSGPAEAGRLRAEYRRSAHAARQRQRQPAEGQFRRAGPGLHHQRQRPDRRPQGLSEHGDRLPERRAGVHARRRHGQPGRAGRRAGRLVQPHAGDRAQRAAPAGRERDRHGQPDHEAAAAAAGRRCRQACRCRSSRTAPA